MEFRIVDIETLAHAAPPFDPASLPSPQGRPRVLVVDQTAGDASIEFGLASPDTFNAMLDAAVAENPGAQIVIKRHPATAAGYRNNLIDPARHPEALTLGYLRNQRLIETIEEIEAVEVDWEREQVNVTTVLGQGIVDREEKMAGRTITTGCAQGTVFSCTLDKLYGLRLPEVQLRQSSLYGLLRNISARNEIYKKAGAVHGCALCEDTSILTFVEDVGRHNAADAISGMMWLDEVGGGDKLFYTTGRLTSEIVMKCALMGIPAILSRSGITHMGLELAQDLGIIMIARAKGSHFLVYNGHDAIDFDAVPPAHPERSGRGQAA